eukprot:TRINITY_DN70_c0_g1_i1.p1 TRINITY_DN70_c0_g1~~TRINITY_DN70_c0_g1_i1.p1  ORF type:complete len:406 (-),score=21.56 TRINITY_DN70_c0_g1_i1:803-2020(-)
MFIALAASHLPETPVLATVASDMGSKSYLKVSSNSGRTWGNEIVFKRQLMPDLAICGNGVLKNTMIFISGQNFFLEPQFEYLGALDETVTKGEAPFHYDSAQKFQNKLYLSCFMESKDIALVVVNAVEENREGEHAIVTNYGRYNLNTKMWEAVEQLHFLVQVHLIKLYVDIRIIGCKQIQTIAQVCQCKIRPFIHSSLNREYQSQPYNKLKKGMIRRVHYRRKHTYRTASNKIKVVKTPGGQLTIQYRKKRGKGQVCGDTGVKLQGIPHIGPKAFKRLSGTKKTIARPYGGTRSADAVKTRIVRAFLLEELKELKKIKVVKEQKKKGKEKKKAGKKQERTASQTYSLKFVRADIESIKEIVLYTLFHQKMYSNKVNLQGEQVRIRRHRSTTLVMYMSFCLQGPI